MEDADPETQALVRKLHREMNGLGRRSRRAATQDPVEGDGRKGDGNEGSKSWKSSRERRGDRHEAGDHDRRTKPRSGSHGNEDRHRKGQSNRERDASSSASAESDSQDESSEMDNLGGQAPGSSARSDSHRPHDSRRPASRPGSVEKDTATTAHRESDVFSRKQDPASRHTGRGSQSDSSSDHHQDQRVVNRREQSSQKRDSSRRRKKKRVRSAMDSDGEESLPPKILMQNLAFEELDRAAWHADPNPIRPDRYAEHRCVKCFHSKLRFGLVLRASALASRRDLARALSVALEPLGLTINRDGLSLHILFIDKHGQAAEFRPVLPSGADPSASASSKGVTGRDQYHHSKTSEKNDSIGHEESNLEWSKISSTAVRVYVR